jgi:electron transport complex protein RnfG
MQQLATNMIRTALLLTVFALVCTVLVAYTYKSTRVKIAEQEREALMRSLHSVINPEIYDNNLFTDIVNVNSDTLLGTDKAVPVFRARMQSKPVGAILTPVAPNGYNGEIKLIIGILYDGTLSGVRVLSHRETPGLGDAIEERRSDWILGFNGKSLTNPGKKGWKVKRDGGQFDQITGATITPRAIVKAVYNALEFFQQNKDKIFAEQSLVSTQPPTGQ